MSKKGENCTVSVNGTQGNCEAGLQCVRDGNEPDSNGICAESMGNI